MVGDYIATAFTNGVPHGVFAVAQANSGSTFNEAIYTGQGLTAQAVGTAVVVGRRTGRCIKLSDKIEKEMPEKGMKPPHRSQRRSK